MELNGILVVDKPLGPTSFDVVHRVRATLKVAKVGHTGTLDPAASGVLPICLGTATRLAGQLTERDKVYEATVRLGATTDTQDATGTILERRDVGPLDRSRVESALGGFVGEIQQVPPMYSAIKKDGKRLYELARAGKVVEREARPVTVHSIELLELGATEFQIRVSCSKGTYVRTLAHDLGQILGCGGHLCALRRTRSGPFDISRAVSLQQLVELGPARRDEAAAWLIPLAEAFAELPSMNLDAATVERRVSHGQPLEVPTTLELPEGARVKILGPDGAMVALAERRGPKLSYLCVLVGS